MKTIPMKEYLAVSLLSQESPKLEFDLIKLLKKEAFDELIEKNVTKNNEKKEEK